MALAAGIDDPIRRRARRSRTFLFLTAVIALSWLFGIIAALALPHASGHRDLPDSRALAALAIEGIGFLAVVGGFIWARRTGRYIVRWRSISSPLTRRQRRLAQRAIAGKVSLEADRTPYLLALASQNRRTTEGMTPLYGGILLLESASVLLNQRPFLLALAGIVVILFIVAAVQLMLVYRRSGRFLAQHE